MQRTRQEKKNFSFLLANFFVSSYKIPEKRGKQQNKNSTVKHQQQQKYRLFHLKILYKVKGE